MLKALRKRMKITVEESRLYAACRKPTNGESVFGISLWHLIILAAVAAIVVALVWVVSILRKKSCRQTEKAPSRAAAGLSCHRFCRRRSEEHTYELQSLMRSSFAVFCLKKQTPDTHTPNTTYKPAFT